MQHDLVADALRGCLPGALADPDARLVDVVPAGNGFSGLTYLVRVEQPQQGERALVVRLGRLHQPETTSSLAAQWRVVTALSRSIGAVHLQEPVWFGPVTSVEFSVALVLTFVPGTTLSAIPATEDPAPFQATGRALARIHSASRSLTRSAGQSWPDYISRSLDEVRRHETRWDDPDPVLRYVVARLRQRPPPALPLVLLHGDPNPDNVVLRPGLATAALIDWERHRLGDPREDLGWLAYMQRLGTREAGQPLPGLVEAYRDASGIEATGLDGASLAYFALFSAVKLIAAQRTRARARPPDPLMDAYWQGLSALDHRAWLDLCASLPT